VDCTGVGDDLVVVALDEQGRPWHATKHPAGWSPFQRMVNAPINLIFVDLHATESAGQLQVLASTKDTQFRTARGRDGSWTPFYDTEALAGIEPGSRVLGGSIAATGPEIHWVEANDMPPIVYEYARFSNDLYRNVAAYMSGIEGNPYVNAVIAITSP
jgi:hypothetical protein